MKSEYEQIKEKSNKKVYLFHKVRKTGERIAITENTAESPHAETDLKIIQKQNYSN